MGVQLKNNQGGGDIYRSSFSANVTTPRMESTLNFRNEEALDAAWRA